MVKPHHQKVTGYLSRSASSLRCLYHHKALGPEPEEHAYLLPLTVNCVLYTDTIIKMYTIVSDIIQLNFILTTLCTHKYHCWWTI